MFIVQKLIWFIFGTKPAAVISNVTLATPNLTLAASADSANAPRRLAALLNVGLDDSVRQLRPVNQLGRNAIGRTWSKAQLDLHVTPVSNLARPQRAQGTAGAPGFARHDQANHRRLTALR